jgi:hypothetical protein
VLFRTEIPSSGWSLILLSGLGEPKTRPILRLKSETERGRPTLRRDGVNTELGLGGEVPISNENGGIVRGVLFVPDPLSA